jgi:thiol-disulfide isomerase/thioredoxin
MASRNRKAEKQRRREERLARDRDQAEQRRSRDRRLKLGGVGIFVLVVAAIVGVSLALGGSDEENSGTAPELSRSELASAPKRLAANLEQGNEVIDGSIESKLAELRGVPVVVNQWASWCPPCRAEFPFFQELSEELRDQVAFVGLDSQDDRGAAEDFLEEFPVNYPSIFDPRAEETASIGGGRNWPTTIYFNRRGERTHVFPGGYATLEQLRADVERYALARG